MHTIENAIENRDICSAIFLDVSKASDAVWHSGLLQKLNLILPKDYCSFLTSYISERYYRVRVDDDYSNIYPINTGVPQGSVLGPILYILFTRDIPVSTTCEIGTFADDTVLMSTAKTEQEAAANLQSALDEVTQWTKKWKIDINSSKSNHIYFTNREIIQYPLFIDNQLVPIVNKAKYLGMTLDTKLKWKEHVKIKHEELKLKYRELTWLIGRTSNLSINNKLLVYNQILKPVWVYGIQLWGCAKNDAINKIQRFQNKVLRDFVRAPWYIRNCDLHRDLRVSTIREEIQRQAEKHNDRLEQHPNELIPRLLNTGDLNRRLQRFKPHDLVRRFDQIV